MSTRSSRFDAATRDLGEIYALGGWVCQGDLEKVASRHSSSSEERAVLVGYLNKGIVPRTTGSFPRSLRSL